MDALKLLFVFIACIIASSSCHCKKSNKSRSITAQEVSCVDERGERVDWFIAYKFPHSENHSFPLNTGYAYAYITSKGSKSRGSKRRSFTNVTREFLEHEDDRTRNSSHKFYLRADQGWSVSPKSITDPDSAILRTLEIVYGPSDDNTISSPYNTIFYNDGPPPSKIRRRARSRLHGSSKAHAKGVLIIDDRSGDSLWLTHSAPEFPPPRKDEELRFYPNIAVNGQTFMCINFRLKESGPQIVNHLITMDPLIYDYDVSKDLIEQLPELKDLLHERKKKKRVLAGFQDIKTSEGQPLRIFSKSSAYGRDIYSGLIEHSLDTSLLVQSWRRGAGGELDSYCPLHDYHVNNVNEMKVQVNGKDEIWSYLEDHSKWAISEEQSSKVFCISDVNRMKSQFKRGGGAVCLRCQECWSIFSNTIADIESCPKRYESV